MQLISQSTSIIETKIKRKFMKHTKISIIGAGAVGSTIAYALLLKNLTAEICLIDIDEKRCRGEILDLSDALPFTDTSMVKAGTNEDARNSDIIVIAAGKRQEPKQTRLQLYETNKDTISSIIKELQPISKHAIIVMVSNPLDLLVLQAQKESGLPHSQVFGTGTFLDTQRLRGILSKKLNIAEQSIHAYVLGEHGDTQFAAWSCAHVGGIPLTSLLDKKELDNIAQQAKDKAYEIISCKGATYWGIATCTAEICRTIIFNQKRVTPLSVYLKQYDAYLSMPAVLGENGIEQVLDIPLNEDEQKLLAHSAETLKKSR